MVERNDSGQAAGTRTISRRVTRAGVRAMPAVLIAAGLWIWFDLARQRCDDRVRSWSRTLAASLERGTRDLPPPATVSVWIEPTLRDWIGEDPRPGVEVRFEPADPEVDSRSPAVEWTESDGGVVSLRCRCDGDLIEIVGIERR